MKQQTNLRVPWQNSLGTRATVITLAVFVVSLWALSFHVSLLLRQDMQRVLGEQQFQTVSAIAAEVNAGLNYRRVAPAALQTLLAQQPILQLMFNGGIFATDANGTAIADVPLSAGRIGTNYIDRESVSVPRAAWGSCSERPPAHDHRRSW